MEEIWEFVSGTDNRFKVSNLGRIRHSYYRVGEYIQDGKGYIERVIADGPIIEVNLDIFGKPCAFLQSSEFITTPSRFLENDFRDNIKRLDYIVYEHFIGPFDSTTHDIEPIDGNALNTHPLNLRIIETDRPNGYLSIDSPFMFHISPRELHR